MLVVYARQTVRWQGVQAAVLGLWALIYLGWVTGSLSTGTLVAAGQVAGVLMGASFFGIRFNDRRFEAAFRLLLHRFESLKDSRR
jgi:hypothetical protein